MNWINWALMVGGVFVFADGIGSVLLKNGQYHSFWFDEERLLRALLGVIIIVLGAAA